MSERGRERSVKKKDAFRLAVEYTKELLEPFQLYAVSKQVMYQSIAKAKTRVRKSNPRFRRMHKVAGIHSGNLGLEQVETVVIHSNSRYLINKEKDFAILHRITSGRGKVNDNANIIISIDEANALLELNDLNDASFKLKLHRFK